MSEKKAPFILVDGSSYLFRAYHVPQLQRMTNSSGMMTGAVFGVINMLKSLIKEYEPEQMAMVFDAKGKTFRNDLYPEYKANRPPMPEDLRQQIEPIHEIVKAMGLPLLVIDGVEADDVIGTLAKQACKEGRETLISTGDKDMAQLVSDHVTLINTMDKTNPITDRDRVIEKFGVKPEQIIDYLALVGDKVDNIPGVDKCGPKTAVKWLEQYGSLQGVIDHADEIGGKIGENLREAIDRLPLSYELATIKLDCDLEFKPEQLNIGQPDLKELKKLYSDMEFRRWLTEVLKELGEGEAGDSAGDDSEDGPSVALVDRSKYETILEQKELDKWIKKLEEVELFAFDTETTSLNYIEAELVGMSFALDNGEAAYLPVAHSYMGAPEQLERDEVLKQLKPLLESEKHKKVGQNLKYDMSVLANYDIELAGIEFDTMLESYCLNSVASRHDMDTLALHHLNHVNIKFEEIAGKGKNQLTFDQIEVEQAAPYASEDADITMRLHQKLWPELKQNEGPTQIFQHIEMPLLRILSKVERNGVLVDGKLLLEKSHLFEKRLKELEKEAYEIAGKEFNLGSPKQLQVIFYEELGLPILKKTPKGQPSTAEEVLQELALDYPLPKLILEHRGLSKLKSTYTDKLPRMISDKTGRVHTSYHQAIAATGRLSSTEPNLQNIPIKTEEGRSIRTAFIAPKGSKILAADYSQIELRIMAHLSQDEGLLKAFEEGLDVHSATAAEVFDVPLDEVTSNQRRNAKAINFGLIYGMSAFGLAKQIDTDRNTAQDYINTYFARYPGVETYMESTKEKAADLGYVETLYGRRLYLPEIHSKNGMRRKAAERTAINAPMQGSAADIIKLAMLEVDKWLKDVKGIKMIMQVHDELVFEVEEDKLELAQKEIPKLMQSVAELSVPLIADVGVGDNWDEAH
ncbi:DNA polymerase I [Kangiella koreensis]|uniref:DNA polymerase I n=1 Tax=Kangiella koreensis (strain DSM 16069 / JCM 12317 / KCTC 12182 / SW-125) TaxID=523791 RepID=C7R9B2_KANKD|nr:DNA polymerase I [Kangiella koreensis]ACV27902.1 DNA polymerase I [Kangiella koreensis DSM 16069]